MKATLLSLVAALVTLTLAPVALAHGPGHISDAHSDSGHSTDTPSSSSDWQNGDPVIHHSASDMDYGDANGDVPPTIDYEGNWGIQPAGTKGDGFINQGRPPQEHRKEGRENGETERK